MGSVAVLVPVKSFADAKLRLAPRLGPLERATLARSMAERVLSCTGGLPTAVVCDDEEVARWAAAHGAQVVWEPGRGLNVAVQAGVAHLAATGARQVIVAHADLPLAEDFSWVARFPGVTLVPDRRDDGTNVACVPARSGFEFSYGPGSFRRHLAEARRLRLSVRTVREASLAWDVDVPSDLDFTACRT
jgi:2-phospho-L-lactate guanylyltransferase